MAADRKKGFKEKKQDKNAGGFKNGGENGRLKKRPERQARRAGTEFSERVQEDFESSGIQEESGILIGRNPVMEALKSGRNIDKLLVLKDAEGSIKKIIGMAKEKNIMISYVDRGALDRISRGGAHQGVAAYADDYEYCDVDDILKLAEEKGEPPFIIVLDGIEDPHNLGAIIRTVDAAGAHGVVIPKRRAATVTPTAEKASAGASAYVRVARVSNIAQTLEYLKKNGVWTAATDMDGTLYTASDLKGPMALVIGSEGKGISRLVKDTCDFCVSIPMLGGVNSLNASNAAAVLMYEVVRQRGIQIE